MVCGEALGAIAAGAVPGTGFGGSGAGGVGSFLPCSGSYWRLSIHGFMAATDSEYSTPLYLSGQGQVLCFSCLLSLEAQVG